MESEVCMGWGTIAQVASTLFVGVMLVVFIVQVAIERKHVKAENILAVTSYLQTPETRKARAVVRGDLKSKRYISWTDEEKGAAATACTAYATAGFLVQREVVAIEIVVSNWRASILDCYAIARPLIKQRKEENGADYWQDFDWLYRKAGGTDPVVAANPS